MKKNQHVKPIVDAVAGTVTFAVKGHNDIVLDMARLHPDIIKRAALVGMAQVRIVDAAAVGMEDDEGNIMREADRIALKYRRMEALVNHYHSGTDQWRQKGGAAAGRSSITIEAIARVKGISYDEAEEQVIAYAEEKYDGDTKKALAYLRGGERVSKAINEIRAERQTAPKIDADMALDELKA